MNPNKTLNKRLSDINSGIVITIVISLSALTLSIFSVATRYPRTNLDFDYLGLLLGILAFITTLLIGWQIAAAFISQEKIREMDSKISQTLNTNLYHVFIIQGKNEEERDRFDSALNYYFKSIECAGEAELQRQLRQTIAKVKQILESTTSLQINKEDSDCYCGIIRKIDHEDADQIIKKVKAMATAQAPSQANSWGTSYTTSTQQ